MRRLVLSGVGLFLGALAYLQLALATVLPTWLPPGYWAAPAAIEANTWVESAAWTLLAVSCGMLLIVVLIVLAESKDDREGYKNIRL